MMPCLLFGPQGHRISKLPGFQEAYENISGRLLASFLRHRKLGIERQFLCQGGYVSGDLGFVSTFHSSQTHNSNLPNIWQNLQQEAISSKRNS